MKDIAVVYKYSALESYSAKQIRRHRELNPELGAHMQKAHDDHNRAFERLQAVTKNLGLSIELFERDTLKENLDRYRLVISLGGDGTFINASHFIEKALLVGVNSAPDHSVGHYCRFQFKTPQREAAFAKFLAHAFGDDHKPIVTKKLLRMQVKLNDRIVGFPILNDILFCEVNPAATSRYTLYYRKQHHSQISSGLWISTPTGSTAAYASAGGKPYAKAELRFIVRELYRDNARKLHQGSLAAGETLKIVSSMMSGALFMDGSHFRVPIALGEHVKIATHPQPLRAIY